jgi:hypothetical protein
MNDKYILMCKEAKEIQNKWKPKEGDFVTYWQEFANRIVPSSFEFLRKNNCGIIVEKEGHPIINCINVVWLPRQEDLQKIYMENQDCNMEYMTLRLRDWLHDKWLHYNSALNDILPDEDQFYILDWNTLWLCFVMETVYGKVWDGKTWIGSE